LRKPAAAQSAVDPVDQFVALFMLVWRRCDEVVEVEDLIVKPGSILA
jgi:hypothetical protein